MKNEWIDIAEFAHREGVSSRAIEQRITRSKIAEDLLDRQPGQGGKGYKTYIHYTALSPIAQAEYEVEHATVQNLDDCQSISDTPACVATPETVIAQPAGRLPEADYWLTVEAAARLMGVSNRHCRRELCTDANQQAGHVRMQADGSYRLHTHLLPHRALRDFYLTKGRPVPEYLLRSLPDVPLDAMPQQERDYMIRWTRILNAFESFHLQQSGTLEQSAAHFCRYTDLSLFEGLKCRPSTLLKKRLRYQQNGPMGLRIGKRGGAKPSEIAPEAWDWLKQIYAMYNGNRSQAVDALMIKAADEGWQIPSKWTLMKRLKEVPQALLSYYKQGKKMFDDKVLPSNLRDYESFPAMYCWVSDHHKFDIMVKWPDGSVRRIWCTLWQDMRSRKITGMILTDNPNAETIALALHDGIKHYGIPLHTITDNGKDYKSRRMTGKLTQTEQDVEQQLRGVYEHLGITDHYAIPYNAKSKPCERTFRRFKEQVCALLPGYTGGTAQERPERLMREQATGDLLTAEAFEDLFRRWLEEKYHTTPHYGHGMKGRSPNEVHKQECLEYGFASEAHLRLLLLKPSEVRTYQRNGFQLFNQFYLVPAASHVAMLGQKYWLRYHPENLNRMHVYDLNDQYVCDAEVVQRSQLFGDEESIRKQKQYHKILKEQARNEINATRRLLRTGIPAAERIGLSQNPTMPQDGRPEGAVIRLTPNKTRPNATEAQGVVDLSGIDPEFAQRVDQDFEQVIKRVANGDNSIDEALEQRINASFTRLIRDGGKKE